MSEGPRTRPDAATAGALLLGAMIACAATGFGVGALVGLAAPLGIAGLFAGFAAGIWLVHARFRRL